MKTSWRNEHLSTLQSHFLLRKENAYISSAVMSWIHCRSRLCLFVCLCVCFVSEDADSPTASVSKSSRINWCLLSYLGPTAVPETEESDEALFCRVWVAAGVVGAGWVLNKHKKKHTKRCSSHACIAPYRCIFTCCIQSQAVSFSFKTETCSLSPTVLLLHQ